MFNAGNDALGIGLATRARQRREQDAAARQETSDATAMDMHDPSIAEWTRWNLGRESAMAQTNPQWDAFFQALSEASGGKPLRMIGGPPPMDAIPATDSMPSRQFRGVSAQPSSLDVLAQTPTKRRKAVVK